MQADAAWLKHHVREVPDFPKPGVVFKDLTPMLAHPDALAFAVSALAAPFVDRSVSKVVGIEARGFIFASPVALALGAGFVPVRKPGKLPWSTTRQTYNLEYGSDAVEIHDDVLAAGDRVAIIDDLIATGGTAAATVELVRSFGAEVIGLGFVVELAELGGRMRLPGEKVETVLVYD